MANEYFRNDTPYTILTDVDTTADINKSNVSAMTSIQEGNNMLFIEQILRHLNMTISMLNNKVDEVSGENTRLTKGKKSFLRTSKSNEISAILLPMMHSPIISINMQQMIDNPSFTFN